MEDGVAILGGCCLAAVLISGASASGTATASVTAGAPGRSSAVLRRLPVSSRCRRTAWGSTTSSTPTASRQRSTQRPTSLCNPVMKTIVKTKQVFKITNPRAHLVCFPMTAPNAQPAPTVVVANQFGTATLQPGKPTGLCVPSWKSLTGPLHMKHEHPAGPQPFHLLPGQGHQRRLQAADPDLASGRVRQGEREGHGQPGTAGALPACEEDHYHRRRRKELSDGQP